MTQGLTYNGTMNYRDGMKEFAYTMDPKYMMVLAFNKPGATTYEYGNDCVRRFHGRLDRVQLGPSWSRIHPNQRSHSISVPQGHNCSGRADSESLYDFHLHMLLKPAPYPKMKLSDRDMENLTREIWTGLVPSGNLHFRNVYDAGGGMDYCSRLMAGGVSTSIGIPYYSIN